MHAKKSIYEWENNIIINQIVRVLVKIMTKTNLSHASPVMHRSVCFIWTYDICNREEKSTLSDRDSNPGPVAYHMSTIDTCTTEPRGWPATIFQIKAGEIVASQPRGSVQLPRELVRNVRGSGLEFRSGHALFPPLWHLVTQCGSVLVGTSTISSRFETRNKISNWKS